MTPRLPALSSGRGSAEVGSEGSVLIASVPNVLAGSFIAEQRCAGAYDLLAVSSPTAHGGASLAKSKLQGRRRPRGHRYDQTKCTILPALESLDALLTKEASEILPDIVSPKANNPAAPRAVTRLYPGRCRVDLLSGSATPAPTDAEFASWLTPPEHGGFTRLVGSPTAADAGEDQKTAPAWHLLLLKSTFYDPGKTAPQVEEEIRTHLGLSSQAARLCVETAQRRMMAVLDTCSDKGEIFRKMKICRSLRLAVQVASSAGVPAAAVDALEAATGKDDEAEDLPKVQRSKAKVASNYSELFRRSSQGQDNVVVRPLLPLLLPKARSGTLSAAPKGEGSSSPRKPQPPEGPRPRGEQGRARREKRWRGEGASVEIELVPEDPVVVVLGSPKETLGKEAEPPAAGAEPAPPSTPPAGSPRQGSAWMRRRGSLQDMVHKHQGNLNSAPRTDKPDDSKEDGALNPAQDPNLKWPSFFNVMKVALDTKGGEHQELSQDRKEACVMLRFFVFGYEGAKTPKEREQVLHETIGSREKVSMLFTLWTALDEDGSGRVDIMEFRAFADQHMKERAKRLTPEAIDSLPSWAQLHSASSMNRFIGELCDKVVHLLLGKKSSFAIDDMMKLLWPAAQANDIKEMRKWINNFSKSPNRTRVKTPPVLPQEDYDGLASVFHQFTETGGQHIKLETLILAGLVPDLGQHADRAADACLKLAEFMDLMCPSGFRVHATSERGRLPDGQPAVFDPVLNAWRSLEEEEVEEHVPQED